MSDMKVVIMGCGRVGAELAATLDREGNDVAVIDLNAYQFDRFLPETFRGRKITGNGIDQDTLRRAGIEEADAFIAVTQGDNRNVMASQIAKHIFGVNRVVCRIYDPIREQMYRRLGLRTICPTKVGARLLKEALEADEPQETGEEPSPEPGAVMQN
jgi:trk system potassium uptake protein TrkA